MNKSWIRTKQIIKSVQRSREDIAAGKCESYTLEQFLKELSPKKELRIIKNIK